jgi:hypothetical protein
MYIADMFIVNKYQQTLLDVLANDVDPNGDGIWVESVYSIGRSAAFPSTDKRMVVYEPLLTNEEYTDSAEYDCSDGTNIASSYLIISVLNQKPIVSRANITVVTNTVDNEVTLDFQDPDYLDEPTLFISKPPQYGTYRLVEKVSTETVNYLQRSWVDVKRRQYTLYYTPVEFENSTLEYAVTDGVDTVYGIVDIYIQNTPPSAIDDMFQTPKNLQQNLTVTMNDYDINGDGIRLVQFDKIVTAHGGNVTRLDDYTVTYTAPHGFIGIDTFNYTIEDILSDPTKQSYSLPSSGKVEIEVFNIPPIAVTDTFYVAKGFAQLLNVTLNDIEPNGDPITVVQISDRVSGTNASIVDGTSILYHAGNMLLTETFTYTIQDPEGANDTTYITVHVVNTPPVAVNDTASTLWNRTTVIYPLTNDYDINPGDFITVRISYVESITASGASAQIVNGDRIRYTPVDGFVGTDTIRYRISDGGDESEDGFVTVSVINNAPIAVDDKGTIHWSTRTITMNVLDNDNDPDNDPFVIVSITQPQNGIAVLVGSTIVYTSDIGYMGSDSLQYTITDWEKASTATVYLNVNNTAPHAAPDFHSVHWRSSASVINVLDNDSDDDGDILSIEGISVPVDFKGSVEISADNLTLLYTPPTTPFKGTTTLTYYAFDGISSIPALVTIKLTNNDAPQNSSQTHRIHWSTQSTGGTTFQVISSTVDTDGDSLYYNITQPLHGNISIVDSVTLRYIQNDYLLGIYSLSVVISDGVDTAVVQVTFEIYNTPPTAQNYSVTYYWKQVDTGVQINALTAANVEDGDNADRLHLGVTNVSPFIVTNIGNASVDGGIITFKANHGWIGSHILFVTFTDGIQQVVSQFNITVENRLPIKNGAAPAYSAHWRNQMTGKNFDVLKSVIDDPIDTLSIVTVISGNAVVDTVSGQQQISYKQNAFFIGTDSFVLRISDGWNDVDMKFDVIVYNNVPTVPVQNGTIHWSDSLLYDVVVLASDIDIEDMNAGLSLSTITKNASHGSATIEDNRIRYTPNGEYTGTDTFEFSITDGFALFNQTMVMNITNRVPIAMDDDVPDIHWTPGTAVFYVLLNDKDPDNDAISVDRLESQPTNGGTVSITNAQLGTLQYSIPGGNTIKLGADAFNYRITDGISFSNIATVRFNVTNANTPLANNITQAIHWRVLNDSSLDIPVSQQKESDGDTLQVILTQPTDGGYVETFVTSSQNIIRYSHNNWSGTTTFPYKLSDGLAQSNGIITVQSQNDPPVGKDYQLSITYNQLESGINIDVLRDADDPNFADKQYLSIALGQNITQPFLGSVSIVNNKIRYVPPVRVGKEIFQYILSDGNMEATYTITAEVVSIAPDAYEIVNTYHWKAMESGVYIVTNESDIVLTTISEYPLNANVMITSSDTIFFQQIFIYTGTIQFKINATNTFGDTVTVSYTVIIEDQIASVSGLRYNYHHISFYNPQTIVVLGNTTDIDGDSLRIEGPITVDNPDITVDILNTTSVRVSTVKGRTGTFNVQYSITDSLLTITNTLVIQISNTPPKANTLTKSLHWRSLMPTNGYNFTDLLSVVTDSDGDTLTIQNPTATDLQLINTITMMSAGIVNVVGKVPIPLGSGNRFQYQISDGADNGLVTNTVNITVTNEIPFRQTTIVYPPVHWTSVSVPFPLTTMFSDNDVPDQQYLYIDSISSSAGSRVLLNSNKTQVLYTSAAGFTGTDTLSYEISDGRSSVQANTPITVYNTLPVTKSYNINIKWSQLISGAVTLPVIQDSYDADSQDNGNLKIMSTTQPASGGAVSISSDNKNVVFTPTTGFTGTISFTFTVSDGLASVTNSSQITIRDNAPVLAAYSPPLIHWTATNGGTLLNIVSLLLSDADSDPITLTDVVLSTNAGGKAVVESNMIRYTPTPAFVTNYTDVLTKVTYTDGWISKQSDISVTVYDNQPQAKDITITIHHSTATKILVVGDATNGPRDIDVADTLSIVNSFSGQYNAKNLTVVDGGKNIYFEPISGITQQQKITYTVTDGRLQSSANLVINLQNSQPNVVFVQKRAHWTSYTTGINVDLLQNVTDADTQDTLRVVSQVTPSQGSIQYVPSNQNQYLIYKPPKLTGSLATYQFNFDVTDGTPAVTGTASFQIYNNIPIAVADTVPSRNWRSNSFDIDVLANDVETDLEDKLNLTVVSTDSSYAVVTSDSKKIRFTKTVQPSDLNTPIVFNYVMTDGQAQSSAQVTVNSFTDTAPSLSVTGLNTTIRWTQNSVIIVASCSDPDSDPLQPLSVQGLSVSTNQVITMDQGTLLVNDASIGRFTFTSNPQYLDSCSFCSVQQSITITCSDGLLSNTATGTITIQNNRPQITITSVSITRIATTTSYTVDVMSTYTDIDGNALIVQNVQGTGITAQPTNANKQVLISVPSNQVKTIAQATFTYNLYDGQLRTGTQTFTVTFNNSPPQCSGFIVTGTKNQALTVDLTCLKQPSGTSCVRALCSDTNLDDITYQIQSPSPSISGYSTTSTTFSIPAQANSGSYVIQVTASDNLATTGSASITVTYNNQAPQTPAWTVILSGAISPNVYMLDYINNGGVSDADDPLSRLVMQSIVSSTSTTACSNYATLSIVNNQIRFERTSAFTSCTIYVVIQDQDSKSLGSSTGTITVNRASSTGNLIAVDDIISIKQGEFSVSTTLDTILSNDYDTADRSFKFQKWSCTAATCSNGVAPTVSGNTVTFSFTSGNPSCQAINFPYVIESIDQPGLTATASVFVKVTNCVCKTPLDVVITWDVAISNSQNFALLKTFLATMTSKFDTVTANQVKIGVVTYKGSATLLHSLTDDQTQVSSKIASVTYDPNTNGYLMTSHKLGLERASALITSSGRTSVPKVVLHITDSETNYPCSCNDCTAVYPVDSANKCKSTRYSSKTCSNCAWSIESRCMPCADPVPISTALNTKASGSWTSKEVVLGVGQELLNTYAYSLLKSMSFDANQVFLVQDYNDLSSSLSNIVDTMCNSVDIAVRQTPKPTPTPTPPATVIKNMDVVYIAGSSDFLNTDGSAADLKYTNPKTSANQWMIMCFDQQTFQMYAAGTPLSYFMTCVFKKTTATSFMAVKNAATTGDTYLYGTVDLNSLVIIEPYTLGTKTFNDYLQVNEEVVFKSYATSYNQAGTISYRVMAKRTTGAGNIAVFDQNARQPQTSHIFTKS